MDEGVWARLRGWGEDDKKDDDNEGDDSRNNDEEDHDNGRVLEDRSGMAFRPARKTMKGRTLSETKQARRFALVLAGILVLLGLLALWKHHPLRARACLAAAMLAPVLAYLALPVWIWFFRAWMKFAEMLGWVMTRVILTVFFYALLTPYGLVARLFRKDPLDLSWKRRRASYWIEKPATAPERERYERQY